MPRASPRRPAPGAYRRYCEGGTWRECLSALLSSRAIGIAACACCRHFRLWFGLTRMGREGLEPSTLGLRVPCSTS